MGEGGGVVGLQPSSDLTGNGVVSPVFKAVCQRGWRGGTVGFSLQRLYWTGTRRRRQGGLRGRSQHLSRGVVTNLWEVSAPLVTSQRDYFLNGVFLPSVFCKGNNRLMSIQGLDG